MHKHKCKFLYFSNQIKLEDGFVQKVYVSPSGHEEAAKKYQV